MITLYSTNPPCPKCQVLHQKLTMTGREFSVVEDTQKLIDMGFETAPILEVDGKFMEFNEAVAWLRG